MDDTVKRLVAWGLPYTSGDIVQDMEWVAENNSPHIGMDYHGFGDYLYKHADLEYLAGPQSGSNDFYAALYRHYGAYLAKCEKSDRLSAEMYPQYPLPATHQYRILVPIETLSSHDVREILDKTRREAWEKKKKLLGM